MQNFRDAMRDGTTACTTARLTDEQVIEIRRMYVYGATLGDVTSKFNLTYNHAWMVVARRIWRHLP